MTPRRTLIHVALVAVLCAAGACREHAVDTPPRASGYVDATETRVASRLAGRVDQVLVAEGATVKAGDVVAKLSTVDVQLALGRAQAERAQALAQLRLLRAGTRPEDIQQAEAQLAAADADQRAADAELRAARVDEARFVLLLDRKAGSEKQRDDAVTRREMLEARLRASLNRTDAARALVARLRSGARREELDSAAARVASVDAQIATIEHDRLETTIAAPVAGIVTARLVEPGELVAAGTPIITVVDLAGAWVNAYVEEPLIPSITLNQTVAIVTDGGHRLDGRIAVIAPRAEFTPRNVQTSTERAKLVYRVKVSTDNREGILKPGMPVEIELRPR